MTGIQLLTLKQPKIPSLVLNLLPSSSQNFGQQLLHNRQQPCKII